MFIEIFHNNPSLKTLSEFAQENGVQIDANFSLENLLNYEGNAERIKAAYFDNADAPASVGRLESPVLIRVPEERLIKEYINTAGNIVYPNVDFKAFFAEEVRRILRDPGYTPINKQSKIKKNDGSISVRKIQNSLSVWVWCRALGDETSPGKLIDVTSFVESVTISAAEHGGNFTMQLSAVKSKHVPGEGWVIDESHHKEYRDQRKTFLSKSVSTYSKSDQIRWQEYFFHNVISTNDVVFIQFEALDMEKQRISEEKTNYQSLFLSTRSLVGRNFDMIGLVDSNSCSSDTSTNEVSIQIAGRDLMKLLIEDGCYFFPLDFASENGGFVNTGSNNQSFKRLVNGELVFFNAYVDRSIEFSLKFIFNLLASIKVCDERLFQHYQTIFRYESIDSSPESQKNLGTSQFESNSYKKVKVPGIWNCIRLVIDPEIASRRIVDSSISTDSGSLLNFVHKVCQDPFVEFYGETFGDKYYFIARKHPFTGKSIKSYLKEGLVIDVTSDVVYGADLRYDDSEVFSWYRLTPRGNFFGDSNGISLLQFPAVFFEEYAEIWGSRPLSIVSNYIDYNYLSNAKREVDLDYLTKQSIQDLSYIIETHAYLPFTRTGTITMLGDRRIKKGMFIRFHPTSELFYVNSVSQTYVFNNGSNDRITTLSVSRGMVEKFIDTKYPINYFNIIDLRKGENGKSMDSNFKVNREVFDFFQKRLQFVSESDARNLIS